MTIEDLMAKIDLSQFNKEMYIELKNQKNGLSNRDKKHILKIFTNSKLETKENILKAIICYAIWKPDEAISQARKKGIFRYKVFGNKGKTKARYYLEYLLSNKEIFGFSETTSKYLKQKYKFEWLEFFYNKTEEKIDIEIANHYQQRIRKCIQGVSFESSLHKELFAYIDMFFLLGKQTRTGYDHNTLSTYSQEKIAEGVSYLLFKYIEKYGISTKKNYCVDSSYINSDRIEKLILLACQINGVVHRVASTGIVRGAASFCLDWAYAQTLNLRMDTYSDNIPMQKLLEKCGFQYCGSFERLGMDKWMAYQKI